MPDKYYQRAPTNKNKINEIMENGDEGKGLPQRVKLLRTILSMTQAKFAKYVGISQSQVCSIEQGIRQPSNKIINKIAKACKCNILWLAFGTKETDIIIAENDKQKKKYIEEIMELMSILDKESLYYLKKQAELQLDIQKEKQQGTNTNESDIDTNNSKTATETKSITESAIETKN